jgi:fumarate hydratase subunit beta
MSETQTPATPVRIALPLSEEAILSLRAGDEVLLHGTLYTGRDAAHKRLRDAIERGEKLPIPLAGSAIYYCGPAPAPPGRAMGSAGPTTSYRMDAFARQLHSLGLKATIGKGDRAPDVRRACLEYRAVYLVAIGGAGALLARTIIAARVIAYEDLGPEAIHELQVDDFPAIVAYDAFGGSVFPADEPLEAEA